MAAPVVTQRVENPFTSATDPLVAFTANTGDLVVVFLSLATAQTITLSDSFTNWTNNNANSHMFYKVIDGTEGGNVQVTLATNCKAAAVAYTIQAGTFATSIAPVSSTVATGTSANPNATAVSPTGSAKDYLYLTWFYSAGEEADDDTWVSVTPTSYSNTVQTTSGTTSTAATNCSLASAEFRSTATTTQDASAWTMAQSLAWRAYTVAVYPVMTGSFTANAIIRSPETGSFVADAIIKKTIAPTGFTADAIKAVAATTVPGSFVADAIVSKSSGTKTFVADAIVSKTVLGLRDKQASGTQPPSPVGAGIGAFAATEKRAQSFVPTSSAASATVTWQVRKSGTPTDDVVFELQSDASNLPSDTVLTTIETFAASSLASATDYVREVDFTAALVAGQKYWLVARRTGAINSTNTVSWMRAIPSSYANGGESDWNGSVWSTESATIDLTFIVAIPGFTADANVVAVVTVPGSFTAAAVIFKTLSPSFTAVAILKATVLGQESVVTNEKLDVAAFGRTGGSPSEVAQSFVPTRSGTLTSVTWWPNRLSSPADSATLELQSDNSNTPSGSALLSIETVLGSSLPTTATARTVAVSYPVTAGTRYWLVARRTGALSDSAYYNWDVGSDLYAGGAYVYKSSGVWSATQPYDLRFSISVGVLVANAVLRKTATASVTANAVLKKTLSATFTTDAVLRKAASATFTANAVLRKTASSSFSADAVLKRTISGTFTADAIKHTTSSASFSANAAIATLIFSDDFNRTVTNGAGGGWSFDAYLATLSVNGSYLILDDPDLSGGRLNPPGAIPDAGTFQFDFLTGPLDGFWQHFMGVVRAGNYIYIGANGDGTFGGRISNGFDYIEALPNAPFEADTWYTVKANFSSAETGGFVDANQYLKVWKRGDPEPGWQAHLPVGEIAYGPPSNTTLFYPQKYLSADLVVMDNVRIWSSITSGLGLNGFTADAVIQRGQSGSVAADAVVKRVQTGSFSAAASIIRAQTGSLTANAVIFRTQSASVSANAVKLATRSGSFTVGAAVADLVFSDDFNRTVADGLGGVWYYRPDYIYNDHGASVDGSFATETGYDEFLGQPWVKSGTFQMDFRIPLSGHFDYGQLLHRHMGLQVRWSVDHYVVDNYVGASVSVTSPTPGDWYTVKQNFGHHATGTEDWSYIKVWKRGDPEPDWQAASQSLSNETPNDPILFINAPGSAFSFDNFYWWSSEAAEWQSTLTADAVIRRAQSGSFAADAVIMPRFSADAVIVAGAASQSGSLTADAIFQRTQTGSFTADAIIKRQIGGRPYRDVTLVASPVAYWRLGETSGAVAHDIAESNTVVFNAAPAAPAYTLWSQGTTSWDDVRAGINGWVNVDTWNLPSAFVGNAYVSAYGEWRALEAFVEFDTSRLPSNATITSARLSIYKHSDGGTYVGDWDLEVYLRDFGGTLDGSDYVPGASLSGLTKVARWPNFRSATAGAYRELDDVALAANINKDGKTRLLLASSRLVAGDTPTEIEYSDIYLDGAYGAKLEVAYTVPANDGDIYGGVTPGATGLLTGDPDTAFHFDGVADTYIWVANPGAVIQTAVSVVAWVDVDPTIAATATVIRRGGDAHDWWIRTTSSGTDIQWSVYARDVGGSSLGGTDLYKYSLSAGRHLIVGVFDPAQTGQESRLYVDGSQVSYGYIPGAVGIFSYQTFGTDEGNIGIGSHHGGSSENFKGTIDEPAVFDYALTPAQIEDLWLAGAQELGGPVTFKADAVIRRVQSGSFTASAIIRTPVPGSFVADAILLRTQARSFTADAVVRASRTGSLVSDAVLRVPRSGTLTTSAIVLRGQAGSLAADAVRQKTSGSSFSANAWLVAPRTGSLTASAIVFATRTGSFSANAITFRTQAGSFVAAAIIKVTVQTYAGQVLGLGPLGYWRLGETSGPNAVDSSGNGHTAVYSGLPTRGVTGLLTGDADKAVTLNGSSQWVIDTYPSIPNMDTGTLMGWVNLVAGDSTIVSFNGGLSLVVATFGQVQLVRESDGTKYWLSSETVSFGTRHFVVATKTGSTVTAYLDGIPLTMVAVNGGFTVTPGDTAMYIGALAEAVGFLNGTVDEVAVFDRVLTPEEVAALWRVGSQGGIGFTADAVIKRAASATLLADAIKRVTTAGSFTASAIVKRTATTAFVSDAVLLRTQAGSFKAEADVRREIASGRTVDAIIQRTSQPSLTSDAIVRRAATGSLSANATIYGTVSRSFSANAVVMPVFRADAIMRRVQSGSFTANAVVMPVFRANAVIKATLAGSFKADAFVQSATSGFFVADAAIKATLSRTFVTDAISKRTAATSFLAAAVLLRTRSAGLPTDAIVQKTVASTFASFADVKATVTAGVVGSSIILAPRTGMFVADASITSASGAIFTADAVLLRPNSGTFSADARLLRTSVGSFTAQAVVLTSNSRTLTASAVLATTRTFGFSANAVSLSPQTGSFSAQASLTRGATGSFTANAVLRSTTSRTFGADAVKQTPKTGSFTAQAYLIRSVLGTLTAAAVLQREATASLSAKAVFKTTFGGTVGLFAVLAQPRLQVLVADAVVRKVEQGQLNANALVLNQVHRSFVADALLRRTTSSAFSADAVLASRLSFTADAVIRGKNDFALVADAVITVPHPEILASLDIVEMTAGHLITELAARLNVTELASDLDVVELAASIELASLVGDVTVQ